MYVHLISNASMDIFPENKLSDFSTILSQPMQLEENEEYEVGLVEINIPYTFNTIKKEDAWLEWVHYERELATPIITIDDHSKLQDYDCRIEWVVDHYEVVVPDGKMLQFEQAQAGLPIRILGDKNRVYRGDRIEAKSPITGVILIMSGTKNTTMMYIKDGTYSSALDLIEAITQSAGSKMTLKHLENTNIVECAIISEESIFQENLVHFSDHLGAMLGFRRQSIQRPVTQAAHTYDPYPGMNCILVFTNFIEESQVGDTRAPLLRLLPFKHIASGDVMSYNCFPIQYKRVVQREINCIRILLANDIGRTLPFTDLGRVALTLHFRKKNNGALHHS
jgi:hypothetical protein